jgi:hypothetical protein
MGVEGIQENDFRREITGVFPIKLDNFTIQLKRGRVKFTTGRSKFIFRKIYKSGFY